MTAAARPAARHAALLALLAGGCYAPDFGPARAAPFRCGDGRCPAGYRCAALGAEAYCVPESAAEPPIPLGRINLDHSPPQLFWTARGLSVIWQLQDAPELHAATWDGATLTRYSWNGFSAPGEIAFAARYHTAARRVVVVWEDRVARSARLNVASFGLDAEGEGVAPRIATLDERPLPVAGFGFSRPGLAPVGAEDVVVAYTFGSPPQVVADNVYCERRSLLSDARDSACRPPAAHTAGAFAVTALPLANDALTITIWRDHQAHVSALAARGFRERIDLPLGEVAAAVLYGERIAALARLADESGRQGGWRVILAGEAELRSVELERAGPVIPGLALDAARARLVVCVPTEDQRLELRSFALPALTPLGAVEVERLSSAPVYDCQLDLSPVDGRVGIAWREAAIVQAFATILQPP